MTEGDLKMVELEPAKKAEQKPESEPDQEIEPEKNDDTPNDADSDADADNGNSNDAVIADTLSESVESPAPNEKFVFCKITLK